MLVIKHATQAKGRLLQWYGKANLSHIERIDRLLKYFDATFKRRDCYLCSSPGRVELIGNHTDHNGGSVIGCTVNRDILAVFAPSDSKFVIASQGFRNLTFDIKDISQKENNSRGMAKGVLQALRNKGHNVGGVVMATHTIIPVGGGMSSSASYQLLLGQMQNYLYNEGKIDIYQLAKAGQYSENVYFNKPSGLLDQTVIATGGIVEMDFRNGVSVSSIESNINDLEFVVINTGSSHANLTNEYRAITQDMRNIAKYYGKDRLCNVAEESVKNDKDKLIVRAGKRAFSRAIHFYEENKRVALAKTAIIEGNSSELLELLEQSGFSSRYLLQNCSYNGGDNVLVDALDYCKRLLGDNGAVRVHGGGFAGTILCVMYSHCSGNFIKQCCEHFGENNVYQVRLRKCGVDIV